MMPSPFKAEDEDLETEIDAAIREHGNDARKTIKALLVANAYLEAAREEALAMVSHGFMRRSLKPRGVSHD